MDQSSRLISRDICPPQPTNRASMEPGTGPDSHCPLPLPGPDEASPTVLGASSPLPMTAGRIPASFGGLSPKLSDVSGILASRFPHCAASPCPDLCEALREDGFLDANRPTAWSKSSVASGLAATAPGSVPSSWATESVLPQSKRHWHPAIRALSSSPCPLSRERPWPSLTCRPLFRRPRRPRCIRDLRRPAGDSGP
jgi:hypothetical protein